MVWVSVGLVLVVLGVSLAARAAWSVRSGEQRGRASNGAHGMGIALGAGLAFWGSVVVIVALVADHAGND